VELRSRPAAGAGSRSASGCGRDRPDHSADRPAGGVEPDQLRLAFPLVAAGTLCERAMIEIEHTAVEIRCRICGETSHVRTNHLLCGRCGPWQVNLLSCDEMLLAHVEFLSPLSVDQGYAVV
jgi:hydrogenase nickel incorporation protein HypA/HybF